MLCAKFRWSSCFIVLSVALCAVPAFAADWPMWRCDAHRSAATTQELASDLHLQWVWEYPPVGARLAR